MTTFLIFFVRTYQFLSLAFHRFLGVPDGGGCRFTPTCSEYMAQSITKLGARQGIALGLKRLSQCHPWGPTAV